MTGVHPIEAESYRILDSEVLHRLVDVAFDPTRLRIAAVVIGVGLALWALVVVGTYLFARPRSMILMIIWPRRSSVSIRLSGDRSRWMTPLEWTASRPCSAWMPSWTAISTAPRPWIA